MEAVDHEENDNLEQKRQVVMMELPSLSKEEQEKVKYVQTGQEPPKC